MKSKLIKGAVFVTISTFFVKILSIFYKIPYQNLTGDKGFYIYQQMYPLFALVVAAGSFAFPLAISEIMVNQKRKEDIISSSFFFLSFISIILSLTILILNPYLGLMFGDPFLSKLFYPLIPLLIMIPLISIGRGLLYSHVESIKKVGISIIVEQLFRVLFIGYILYLFVSLKVTNLYQVAEYSFYGFSIGILMSLLIIPYKSNYQMINVHHIDYKLGFRIIKRGSFLLISASLILLLQLIDSFTIIHTLNNQIPIDEAMIIKGIYDRALPVIQSVIFFVPPLISSIIPHIHIKDDYRKLVIFIFYLSLPATLGLIFVFEDLNLLLFNDNRYTSVLQISAIIVFLYALLLTFLAITKDNKSIMRVIILGLTLKIFGNLILIDKLGIIGASISSVMSLFIMLLMIIVKNYKSGYFQVPFLIKITVANGFMILVLSISRMIPFLNHLSIQILLGIISYLIISVVLNIKKTDFMINYSVSA